MKDIKNKTCVVTGSAKSIGFALSKRLAEIGANVVMLDIDKNVLRAAETLKSNSYNVTGFIIDITDENEVSKIFSKIREIYGDIYALVNVAGAVHQARIDEVRKSDWERMMSINVYGSFFCIKEVLEGMKQNHEGKIINFSSKSGKTGSALMIPYSSAKGAVIAMTQAIANEVAEYGINVNALCPGIVEDTGVWDEVSHGYIHNLNMDRSQVIAKFTNKIPLKRLARIDDIVDFCEFLILSGEYCTGQAFNISGGREMH